MGDDAEHAGECLGPRGVDGDDARMRMGTAQNLAVHHALDFKIDSVFE